MAETLTINRLVIFLSNFTREPTGIPGMELLTLDMTVKNPIGSLGSTERPPMMEIRDEMGRVFPVIPDDAWVAPLEPDETVDARPTFEIAEDATGLDLVLAPGTDEETHVALVEEYDL
jgi:hypothetical protein